MLALSLRQLPPAPIAAHTNKLPHPSRASSASGLTNTPGIWARLQAQEGAWRMDQHPD